MLDITVRGRARSASHFVATQGNSPTRPGHLAESACHVVPAQSIPLQQCELRIMSTPIFPLSKRPRHLENIPGSGCNQRFMAYSGEVCRNRGGSSSVAPSRISASIAGSVTVPKAEQRRLDFHHTASSKKSPQVLESRRACSERVKRRRRSPIAHCLIFAGAAHIFSCSRIDADGFTFSNKQRNPHHRSGLSVAGLLPP